MQWKTTELAVLRQHYGAAGAPGGPHGKYRIHRRDLRAWIAGHPEYIDLRRVDQAWFWDVMFPGAQVTKMPSQAAREAA